MSKYAVIDGLGGEWLEEYVGGCTCSSPDAALGHEPGCGGEGVARVEDLVKAEREREGLRQFALKLLMACGGLALGDEEWDDLHREAARFGVVGRMPEEGA